MKFSTFNGLKNHFLILHKDSNFLACVCHVCYGSFRAHKLLRAHLKNVHNLNYGNISVPQNQEANDKIVDSSNIKDHSDKFLELIEWGSNTGVRQIPPISIEECQKTNELPQPGKQQQQAEIKQDLEKELNIQNHWQKEKQDPKNKEEIRKQTRHQWKKQRQEWKKWDPKKQLELKKQVQPENPQNIEKQQHIGFLLREQLQDQLQKQQHHPKSVQKQTIESIEQHTSLLQKQLQPIVTPPISTGDFYALRLAKMVYFEIHLQLIFARLYTIPRLKNISISSVAASKSRDCFSFYLGCFSYLRNI